MPISHNLRFCTRSQNCCNRQGKDQLFKGVKDQKIGKKRWSAGIVYEGKRINIGMFDNPRYAALCYDLWARDIYGEFAFTNFKVIGS